MCRLAKKMPTWYGHTALTEPELFSETLIYTMANTQAAKKDLRQTAKRTQRNLAKKKRIKEALHAALAAITGKQDNAQELVNTANKALDKAAKTNTIHPNKAARMKSSLQRKLNADQ